jgi:hypothetical protein
MGMLDKSLLWLNSEAYNATPAPIDLGEAVNPGGGKSIDAFIVCAAKDMAGTTALVIKGGTTSAGATGTTLATLVVTHTQINAGFNFRLPHTGLLRFVTISLTNVSAGTKITAGLHPWGVQDAK